MELKLTNYNEKIIDTVFKNYEFNSSGKIPVPLSNKNQLVTINDLVKFFSENNILSYKKNFKLNIVFEDFNNFTNLIFKLKNFGKDEKYSSWHNEINNTIHIIKSDFNPQLSTISKKIIDSGFNLNDVLNFIVLHEVGHAIQNNLYFINKNCFSLSKTNFSNFVNHINFYKGYFEDINGVAILDSSNISRILHKTLKESFADLFAIYSINKIYEPVKSKKLIECIIKSRKDLQPLEKYFTFGLLESFSNNIPKFNSFNELNNHFELLISNHLKDTISSLFKEANSYTNQVTNHFLGFVDKVLNLNLNDPIKVSNYLLKNYDIYF